MNHFFSMVNFLSIRWFSIFDFFFFDLRFLIRGSERNSFCFLKKIIRPLDHGELFFAQRTHRHTHGQRMFKVGYSEWISSSPYPGWMASCCYVIIGLFKSWFCNILSDQMLSSLPDGLEQCWANMFLGDEQISEYICWCKSSTNEYPNIFVGVKLPRTNIRIYSNIFEYIRIY